MNHTRTYATSEIASMFGLRESYLRKLRQLRKGPKYFKLGRMVRYRKEDIDSWLGKAVIEIQPKSVV